jgi:hypothetical protein
MGYTLAQFRAFTAAAANARRMERRDTLLLMRAAQADDKGFKKALKAWSDG